MNWEDFEKNVAELFSLFGYESTHDTKVSAGQTDVLAISPRRNRPNIMVECKYHELGKVKVGIDDVQRFAARVTTARLNGVVDQGYLVTNTGFTADGRASLQEQPQEKYVFLVTYKELLQTLLDPDNYLKDFISTYEEQGKQDRFVHLSIIDTTGLPATLFELVPGDQVELTLEPTPNSETVKSVAVVIDSKEFDQLVSKKLVSREPRTRAFLLNNKRILAKVHHSDKAKLGATEHLKQGRHLHLCAAIRSVGSELPEDIVARLGYKSIDECRELLKKKPIRFLDRLTCAPEQPSKELFRVMPRRYRWKRDLDASNSTEVSLSPPKDPTIALS